MGGLTGEDLSSAGSARWIIPKKASGPETRAALAYLTGLIREHPSDYMKIVLDCPDTPFQNREDPDQHYYRTDQHADPVTITNDGEVQS